MSHVKHRHYGHWDNGRWDWVHQSVAKKDATRIMRLRVQARTAGDYERESICSRALDGDREALALLGEVRAEGGER